MSKYFTLKEVVDNYLMSKMCAIKNKNTIRRMKRMDNCLWFTTNKKERIKKQEYHIKHRTRYTKPFLIPIWNPNGEPTKYFTAFCKKI